MFDWTNFIFRYYLKEIFIYYIGGKSHNEKNAVLDSCEEYDIIITQEIVDKLGLIEFEVFFIFIIKHIFSPRILWLKAN